MKRGGYYLMFASLVLAIAVSTVFYFVYYKPHQDELIRVTNKIQGLRVEIESEENSIAFTKKDIASMDLSQVNLNYFTRNGVGGEDKIAFFLKVLNEQANKLGINFLSINPDVAEKKNGYVKESFEIRIKTDFHRLTSFLYHLQNALGFNINRMSITAEEDTYPSQTTTVMKLNSLEMTEPKDQKARILEELRALNLKEEPNLRDIKLYQKDKAHNHQESLTMIQEKLRDPFVKPKNIRKIQERLKQLEKELKESQLLGIIDFEGQKHAIIGRHTVKKGDRIFNMDVLEITSEHVVLGMGELKFTYYLKKNENNLIKKQGES